MTSATFEIDAKSVIKDYLTERFGGEFGIGHAHTVWMCKTLQHFKGIFSTFDPVPLFFEVTYNGDKHEMYLDVYEKVHNRKITME